MFVKVRPSSNKPDIMTKDSESVFYHCEVLLRLCGLYFDPLGRRTATVRPSPCGVRLFFLLTSILTLAVQGVYLALTVRTPFLWRTGDGFSEWNILTVSYCCVYFSQVSISLTISHLFPRQLPRLFLNLQDVTSYNIRPTMQKISWLALIVFLFTVCFVPLTLINNIVVGDSQSILRLHPFHQGEYERVWATAVYITISVVFVFGHIFIMITIFAVCLLIGKEFQSITNDITQLQELKDNEEVDTNSRLEELRLRYEAVHALVVQADSSLRYAVLVGFFFGIPYFCFGTYCLTRGDALRSQMGGFFSLMALGLLQMITCSFSGSYLNSKAIGMKDVLLKFGLAQLGYNGYSVVGVVSSQGTRFISLLLCRVSGPPIGLTMLGAFTIDRSSVLTVFGTLFSYAVLVVQMSPTLSTADRSCNNNTQIVL